MMKRFTLFTFLTLAVLSSGNAQINLIGASSNQVSGLIDIVKWQAYDSSSVSYYPTPFQGYLLCSSVFDAWNSNYYLTGVTATGGGLLSFNSLNNTQNLSNFTNFSNISEIDMSTGKIYTLSADSSNYFTVNQYDILTGTDSIIGIVYEPNTMGIVVDATGFDSNNGILFYIGYDSTGANSLYSLFVRTPLFSYSKTPLQTTMPNNSFQCVNYDNVNNLLFALCTEYDTTWNTFPSKLVEINKNTGAITTRTQFTGMTGHQVGSSSFDQQTGSFLFIGVDSSFLFHLIVFNTSNNTLQTGSFPYGVSEIVCDNYNFAKSTYGVNSIPETGENHISIFPNPAEDFCSLTIKEFDAPFQLSIRDINGRELVSKRIHTSFSRLDIHDLVPGVYLLQIRGTSLLQNLKLIKR
jgi:hypothetical protein